MYCIVNFSLILTLFITFGLTRELDESLLSSKINGSFYSLNPWGKDDNNNCEFLPWISLQESAHDSQYLIVKFDVENKIPIFSIYEHNHLSDMNDLPRLSPFYDYPCPKLKGLVLKDSEYKKSGWSRGHLSPQMEFKYSEEARAASNYLVNIAPQDPHSNTQPWSQIEQKIHKFLKERKALVITGTCNKVMRKSQRERNSLPIPDCFWKIVCTRDNNNVVTAAAFYHKNIMSTTAQQKEDRNQEIFQIRDPEFVEGLISESNWDSLWTESENILNPPYDGKPIIKFSDCHKAKVLTSSGRIFWERAIGIFQKRFRYEY